MAKNPNDYTIRVRSTGFTAKVPIYQLIVQAEYAKQTSQYTPVADPKVVEQFWIDLAADMLHLRTGAAVTKLQGQGNIASEEQQQQEQQQQQQQQDHTMSEGQEQQQQQQEQHVNALHILWETLGRLVSLCCLAVELNSSNFTYM